MGSLAYTAVLIVVTLKLALEIRSWSYFHHIGTRSYSGLLYLSSRARAWPYLLRSFSRVGFLPGVLGLPSRVADCLGHPVVHVRRGSVFCTFEGHPHVLR